MELTRIDLENKIEVSFNACRGYLSTELSLKTILFELTMKRFVDDTTYATSVDNIFIVNVMKNLYSKDEKQNLVVFEEVGRVIEEAHEIPKGLFNDFFTELYRQQNWSKAIAKSMDIIAGIDTIKNQSLLSDTLAKLIIEYSDMRSSTFTSNRTVTSLLKIITDVQSYEKLLDGTIGYGISAVACTENMNARIIGVDKNRSALMIAAMYCILSGKTDIQLYENDFTLWDTTEKYEKIAMDIPFGVKVGELIGTQKELAQKWFGIDNIKSLEWIMLAKTLELLKENGKAVVMVPQGVAFKSGKYEKQFKNNVLENNLLSAVISLPPLYTYTGIRTSILVFENNSQNTVVIDLDNNSDQFFIKERNRIVDMSEQGKVLIRELLSKRQELSRISAIVSYEEFEKKNFDLSAAKYVMEHETIKYRTVKEIDKELDENYAKLKQLITKGTGFELFQ